MVKVRNILFVGTELTHLEHWDTNNRTEVISSINFLDAVTMSFMPDLIIFDGMRNADVKRIRENERLVRVPVLIVEKSFAEVNNLNAIADYPKVLVCNTQLAQSTMFYNRIEALFNKKNPVLPPRRGITVKYAILYINKNVSRKIDRTKVASQLGVDEDYLSRIFHEEMGIPIWTYINIYRLSVARRLLLETGIPLRELSAKVGYTDTGYFCKAFKKLYGVTPSEYRKEND